MLPLTDERIRASFINASQRERKSLTVPDLDAIRWESLDYLGWRDPKYPQLGCVIVELDGDVVGILLRQSDGRTRSRPQCSWCEDVLLPNDVVFFVAKRAGDAGRKGDTIGTLVCSHFECSANVRKRPATAYIGFDVEAARIRRIEGLRERVTSFAGNVRG